MAKLLYNDYITWR